MHKQINVLFWSSTILLVLTYMINDSYANYDLSSYSDETCGNTKFAEGVNNGAADKYSEQRWPWIAAVFVRQKFACTANFISRTRAIAAAHCIKRGVTANEIALYIFSNRYVTVKSYKSHPNNDIAIIETKGIHEKSFVPVCLTDDNVSLRNTLGSILTRAQNNNFGDLHGTEISVVGNQDCVNSGHSTFCAGQNTRGTWSCRDDADGGFMTKQNTRWFLRGVLSECNSDNRATFTDVTQLLPFVTGEVSGVESVELKVSKEVEVVTNQDTESFTDISNYSPTNCGELYVTGGFLKGGEFANATRWPWIAAMYVKNNYSCTVNFITSSRAVTAAHCFLKVGKVNDISLLIFNEKYIGVEKYAKHPRFKQEPLYDIAILDTDTITYAGFIPICLTKTSQSIVGVHGNVLTYTLDPKIDYVDLRQAKFSTVQRSNCQKVFNHVPNHSLCVLHGHKGAYLCHGDSGAGFLTLAENSNYGKDRITLRGIVSTGASDLDGDCTVKDYVIFTDVTKFISFVTSKI